MKNSKLWLPISVGFMPMHRSSLSRTCHMMSRVSVVLPVCRLPTMRIVASAAMVPGSNSRISTSVICRVCHDSDSGLQTLLGLGVYILTEVDMEIMKTSNANAITVTKEAMTLRSLVFANFTESDQKRMASMTCNTKKSIAYATI